MREMRATTDHIGCYHNGEVAGGHLVPLLQLADLVEEPEQVLDVPVVLHRQAVVLQEVPHQVLPLLALLNPARLQPVGVELGPEEWLGELPEVGLDGGGQEVVVRRLQAGQGVQAGRLQLSPQSLHLQPIRGQY